MTGTTINSSGFGIALAKKEGEKTVFDPGSSYKAGEKSKSKWIELRYDPEDQVPSVYDELEKAIFMKNLTDNENYALITALANRFVKDKGI